MVSLLSALLFGVTFAVSLGAIYASVRPQVGRIAELFGLARPALSLPVPPNQRITVRYAPVRVAARAPGIRAAA